MYVGLVGWLDTFQQVDRNVLIALNGAVQGNGLMAHVVASIGRNPLVRGFPVFLAIAALWFATDDVKRRSRMLAGLFATALVVAMSLWTQHHLVTHMRPFLDASLGLQGVDVAAQDHWDRVNSFPSDTAALYFSLTMVVFLESRLAGVLAFVWLLFSVGFVRVALGWHYPSDVLASMIAAPCIVYLIAGNRHVTALFERALKACEPCFYMVHAAVFLFLADAYHLFPGLQGILHGVGAILSPA